MTILEALDDPHLLGAGFRETSSWRRWHVALAALFGLPMTADAAAVFSEHTGRASPPPEPAREAWFVVGRRGGKSRIAAPVAVYLACFRDYRPVLAPGERGTLALIAADRQQARTVFRYVGALLDGSPMLARLIERRTADSIDLANGVTIEVHTASFRSVRGYTVVGAVLDEVAFWRSEDRLTPTARSWRRCGRPWRRCRARCSSPSRRRMLAAACCGTPTAATTARTATCSSGRPLRRP